MLPIHIDKFILTLDYELFFGKASGTPEKCLLEPIQAFEETILSSFPVETIIFVDVLYLYKLSSEKKRECKNALDSIRKQLLNLVSRYTNVKLGLHLHTHWLDAIYDEGSNTWKFPTYKNYIASLLPESKLREVFEIVKYVQEKLLGNYQFEWFRAGGWCIEPFNRIAPYLKMLGIKKDSTVVHGFELKTEVHNVNFKQAPLKPYWRFSKNTYKEDENGFFEEYPICSVPVLPVFFKIWNHSRNNRSSKSFWGDGQPAGEVRKNFKYYLRRIFSKQVYMLNFEYMSAKAMEKVIEKYVQRVKFDISNDKHKVIFIAHPKALSLWSLEELKRFLRNGGE